MHLQSRKSKIALEVFREGWWEMDFEGVEEFKNSIVIGNMILRFLKSCYCFGDFKIPYKSFVIQKAEYFLIC